MANALKIIKGSGECVMAGTRIGLSIVVGSLLGPFKILQRDSIGIKTTLEDAKLFWNDGIKDIKEGLNEER